MGRCNDSQRSSGTFPNDIWQPRFLLIYLNNTGPGRTIPYGLNERHRARNTLIGRPRRILLLGQLGIVPELSWLGIQAGSRPAVRVETCSNKGEMARRAEEVVGDAGDLLGPWTDPKAGSANGLGQLEA